MATLPWLDSRIMSLWALLWVLSCLIIDAQRIAVIGGGISGTFFTKYLVDHDVNCRLESITLYEPLPYKGPLDATTAADDDWQGSRVQSIRLADGTVVELGASIGFKEFHLVLDLIRADEELQIGPPINTGSGVNDTGLRDGMGIYEGDGQWSVLTTNRSSFRKKLLMLWRYGRDLFKVSKLTDQMVERFAKLPSLLASTNSGTFFASPDEVWSSIGLYDAVHRSFDALLDATGVSKHVYFWQRWLGQGSLRDELLTAINLVNYNQNVTQVNGIVGLGSFAASGGGLFSIVGGNSRIIASALRQAMEKRQSQCGSNNINEIATRVTTAVANEQGMALYAGTDFLGTYDIVVLASPLQQARVEFTVQSKFDPSVLQPMHLGGLVVDDDDTVPTTPDGWLPNGLPPSAMRPYTQVVTTVVSNATLSADFVGLNESALPRSILMTDQGKSRTFNMTSITQVSSNGVYKMFSDDKLSPETLTKLFGPQHRVEYVKLWGGPHGGATPNYQGQGTAPGFLLFDGTNSIEGDHKAGALYYPSAMEQSSLACMELSAIGAKAVAKLIALRLGLVKETRETIEVRDEL